MKVLTFYILFTTIMTALILFDLVTTDYTLVLILIGGPLITLMISIMFAKEYIEHFCLYLMQNQYERLLNVKWPIKKVGKLIFVRNYANRKLSLWRWYILKKSTPKV